MQKCRSCGATEDLWTEPVYVGGHGYVVVTECRFKPACWLRQEEQTENRRDGRNAPAA